MSQSYFDSAKRNNSGFSLIETLVALAIICVTGLLIGPGLAKHFKVVKNVARGGICDSYMIHSFSQLDRYRLDPSQPHPFLRPEYQEVLGLSSSQDYFTIPARVQDRFTRMGVTQLYELNPAGAVGSETIQNNGVRLYTPLLANDRMGYLADLYALDYRQDFRDLPPELVPPPIHSGETFQGQIQIRLYNLDDLTEFTPSGKVWPRPRNQFERDRIFYPMNTQGPWVISEFPDWISDDFGFQVTVRGTLRDNTGQIIGECERTQSYSYAMDFHNVLDFSSDMTVVRKHPSGSQLVDNTPMLSNKHEISSSLDTALHPIFTNLSGDPGQHGRERPLCSQDNQNISNFFLRLRIYDLDKEAGVLPVCIDNSKQWLAGEVSGGGWCARNNITGENKVAINYDWKPGLGGWVPCEKMKFCGQNPTRVDVLKRADAKGNFVEYRYHYDIQANDNAMGNQLWGCEIKYLTAAVDTSGNLLYPPRGGAPPVAGVTDPTVITDHIREVNPKIYFKPPPCYICDCNPCKRGSFFKRIFKWLILAVLIASTGGAYAAYGLISYITSAAASLTVACSIGGIGCEKPNTIPDNLSNAGAYTACQDTPNPATCNCGHRCQQRRVPGPGWSDSLDPSLAIADNDPRITATACSPSTNYPITTDGVSLTAQLGYRKQTEGSSEMVLDTENLVLNGDTVAWQEFNPATGKFCTVQYKCNNKNWEPVTEAFETETGEVLTGPMVGCFDVKVGHQINWTGNPADPSAPKPGLGPAQCLEVQFNKTPFAANTDRLYGHSMLQAECGRLNPTTGTVEFALTEPHRRVAGTLSPGVVASPITLSDGSTATFATNTPIYNSDGYGSSYLDGYTQCTPPEALPQGPFSETTDKEQLYYEDYSTTHQNLPFCTLERNDFDRQ
jgi:prepilin-type N-terminal cleavage/methylation domain-containing protein